MRIVNFRKSKNMLTGKIITAKQMKTVLMKDESQGRENTVMENFRKKGGADLLKNEKADQKNFWNALREDSKERGNKGGDKGFTKDDLEEFFAKELNAKSDNFSDSKVKKIFTKVYGLNRARIVKKAAELRHKGGGVDERQGAKEKNEEKKKEDIETRSHINDIILRGREKSRAGASSIQSKAGHHFAGHGQSGVRDDAYQKSVTTKFSINDSNFIRAQEELYKLEVQQKEKNNSKTFEHKLNRLPYAHAGGQAAGIEEAKARLARVQGKDSEEIDFAA